MHNSAHYFRNCAHKNFKSCAHFAHDLKFEFQTLHDPICIKKRFVNKHVNNKKNIKFIKDFKTLYKVLNK